MLTIHLGSDELESRVAIRYLGGILQLPSFWVQSSHDNHQAVVRKAVERTNQLIEDLDLQYVTRASEITHRADVQGIDTIASALLKGAKLLDQKEKSILSRPLLEPFRRLVGFLRQSVHYPALKLESSSLIMVYFKVRSPSSPSSIFLRGR